MELTVDYPALTSPLPVGSFEGDLTLELAALPIGARVIASTLTASPVAAGPGGTFAEELLLADGTGGFGATTSRGSDYIEVDFHTRRGLVSATPVSTPAAAPTLQVDVGGLLLDVGSAGQVPAPAGDKGYPLPNDGTLPALTVSRFRLHGAGVPDLKAVTGWCPGRVPVLRPRQPGQGRPAGSVSRVAGHDRASCLFVCCTCLWSGSLACGCRKPMRPGQMP
jgi:hypothetical protein